jgi:hypothetical protein
MLQSATCLKNIGDGPIKWLLLRRQKPTKCGHTPSLTTRSMIKIINKYTHFIMGVLAHMTTVLVIEISCRQWKIQHALCLLFTILRPFETRESITRKTDHGGRIVLWYWQHATNLARVIMFVVKMP